MKCPHDVCYNSLTCDMEWVFHNKVYALTCVFGALNLWN